jgi:hypothetical protein
MRPYHVLSPFARILKRPDASAPGQARSRQYEWNRLRDLRSIAPLASDMKKYQHVINVGIQNTLVCRMNFLFRSSFNPIPRWREFQVSHRRSQRFFRSENLFSA